MKNVTDMKVKTVYYDDEEGYFNYTMGVNHVIAIEYHAPSGEGDSHYCDIELDNGKVIRQFKPNSIEFI